MSTPTEQSPPAEPKAILERQVIPLLPFLRLGQKSPGDQQRLDRIAAGELPNSTEWCAEHGVEPPFLPNAAIAGRWLFNGAAEAEECLQEFAE